MSKTEIEQSLKDEIASNPILLYIKGEKNMPVCGYSMRVVEIFKQLGKDFETRNVLADPERLAVLKEMADWPTTPQIYINGEFVGGCDIAIEMFESGELQKMVESIS